MKVRDYLFSFRITIHMPTSRDRLLDSCLVGYNIRVSAG